MTRMKFLRILPPRCPRTLCPLSSAIVNIAFGDRLEQRDRQRRSRRGSWRRGRSSVTGAAGRTGRGGLRYWGFLAKRLLRSRCRRTNRRPPRRVECGRPSSVAAGWDAPAHGAPKGAMSGPPRRPSLAEPPPRSGRGRWLQGLEPAPQVELDCPRRARRRCRPGSPRPRPATRRGKARRRRTRGAPPDRPSRRSCSGKSRTPVARLPRIPCRFDPEHAPLGWTLRWNPNPPGVRLAMTVATKSLTTPTPDAEPANPGWPLWHRYGGTGSDGAPRAPPGDGDAAQDGAAGGRTSSPLVVHRDEPDAGVAMEDAHDGGDAAPRLRDTHQSFGDGTGISGTSCSGKHTTARPLMSPLALTNGARFLGDPRSPAGPVWGGGPSTRGRVEPGVVSASRPRVGSSRRGWWWPRAPAVGNARAR